MTLTAQEQFIRTASLLAWFRDRPRASLMEASRRFGVPVAQIRHELKQVSDCGIPGYYPGSLVEVSLDRMTATVDFAAGLDGPLQLTTMEAGVLLFCLEALGSTLPEEERSDVDGAARAVRRLLRSRRGAGARGGVVTGGDGAAGDGAGEDGPGGAGSGGEGDDDARSGGAGSTSDDAGAGADVGGGPRDGADTAAVLTRAVADRRVLAVDYLSLSSDVRSTRLLVPDHVGIVEGRTYLWAREWTPADADPGVVPGTLPGTTPDAVPDAVPASAVGPQRTWAVARIRGVRALDVEAPPAVLPDVDPEDPFGFAGHDAWATLTLAPSGAWMYEYFPVWHVDGEDDGVVTIADTGEWLDRFLVAYSPEIVDVAPPDVAERVRERARRALGVYGAD
ncbi:WYL domain-containing protein [Corynebacterium bovis]|uniref:WYL domain-containing protein n=1 Tax=Corynebacterium bovis TaxID=36808 RepID=UPI00254F6CC1|nr:WYL domain-containing protein [Corynebacterium bovis]MDK8509903.1 WYL domain-containing protein [Corynebacterium bovis]